MTKCAALAGQHNKVPTEESHREQATVSSVAPVHSLLNLSWTVAVTESCQEESVPRIQAIQTAPKSR